MLVLADFGPFPIDSETRVEVNSASLKNGELGMGAVVPALIIGTPGFSADDLIALQRETGTLVGANVVRTIEELSECLDHQTYSFVLHLYDVSEGSFSPTDTLSLVNQKLPNVPFVVAGRDLSIAHAVDLMAAGAADCLAADDDRNLDEVVRHATAPTGT